MKLCVFGATGGVGRQVVEQALEAGHDVTAFVRTPSKLDLQHSSLRLEQGDVFDPKAVLRAVHEQDVVICSLGSASLKKNTVRSDGTRHIIEAMKQAGVKRLLVVTSMGVGDSRLQLSTFAKFFVSTVIRNPIADHEIQEGFVRESGLDWTIVRPSGLVDADKTGGYLVGDNASLKSSRIARADVAHFLLSQLEETEWLHKATSITNP
jgi:putative NADH-flavin reductase